MKIIPSTMIIIASAISLLSFAACSPSLEKKQKTVFVAAQAISDGINTATCRNDEDFDKWDKQCEGIKKLIDESIKKVKDYYPAGSEEVRSLTDLRELVDKLAYTSACMLGAEKRGEAEKRDNYSDLQVLLFEEGNSKVSELYSLYGNR